MVLLTLLLVAGCAPKDAPMGRKSFGPSWEIPIWPATWISLASKAATVVCEYPNWVVLRRCGGLTAVFKTSVFASDSGRSGMAMGRIGAASAPDSVRCRNRKRDYVR